MSISILPDLLQLRMALGLGISRVRAPWLLSNNLGPGIALLNPSPLLSNPFMGSNFFSQWPQAAKNSTVYHFQATIRPYLHPICNVIP